MPLPKPNMAAWGYDGILPQFGSKENYYEQILPKRLKYLRSLIDHHSPAGVIGYGKSYWQHYRILFPASEFKRRQIDEIADGQQFVLLSHHFTARSMNGRFSEIANIIRDGIDTSA